MSVLYDIHRFPLQHKPDLPTEVMIIMSVALRVYEQLTEAPDDKARARVIADAFDQLETTYPALKEAATQTQLRETELRLQKEIGQVRLEIEQVRLEIKNVEVKLKELEVRLTQAIHRQTLWVVGSVGAMIGLIRFLDWLLTHVAQ